MRKRRRGRRQLMMPEITLTPLIDTALTLLIIFMVTAPTIHNALKFDLPKGESQEGGKDTSELIVRIDKTGTISFNDIDVANIIGLHVDTYLKGTATRTVSGDVRGEQIELVTDDAGTGTYSGKVVGLRFRTAFSATGITGLFVPISVEKPEAQTNSQNYDGVLDLTSTVAGVWHDDPATEPSTAAGYVKVYVNGNARYIQLYSTAPTD